MKHPPDHRSQLSPRLVPGHRGWMARNFWTGILCLTFVLPMLIVTLGLVRFEANHEGATSSFAASDSTTGPIMHPAPTGSARASAAAIRAQRLAYAQQTTTTQPASGALPAQQHPEEPGGWETDARGPLATPGQTPPKVWPQQPGVPQQPATTQQQVTPTAPQPVAPRPAAEAVQPVVERPAAGLSAKMFHSTQMRAPPTHAAREAAFKQQLARQAAAAPAFTSTGKVSTCPGGDVFGPGVLKACLAARNANKELILLQGPAGEPGPTPDRDMDLLVNQLLSMEALGWAHTLVLTGHATHCTRLAGLFPSVGCIWHALAALPAMSGLKMDIPAEQQLWMVKWIICAIGVQEGYNLLVVDLSVSVQANLYRYLKNKDVFNGNLITMKDTGDEAFVTEPSLIPPCMYLQRCKRGGPVAWLAAAFPEYILRWAESAFPNPNRPSRPPDTSQHTMLSDLVLSTMLGRPIFKNMFAPKASALESWASSHSAILAELQLKMKEVTMPQEWAPIYHREVTHTSVQDQAAPVVSLPWSNLQVPSAPDGEWPEELGGPPFKEGRGPAAQWVADFIAKESQGSWPDLLTPSQAPSEAPQPGGVQEKWMPAPNWLFGSYSTGGEEGWWATEPPRVAAASWLLVGTAEEDYTAVQWALKMYGWWLWEATAKSATIAGPPPATSPVLSIPPGQVQLPPQTQLIAYAPGCRLRTQTEAQLVSIKRALIAAALLSGRAPVWPELDCSSAWITQDAVRPNGVSPYMDRLLVVGIKAVRRCFDISSRTSGCTAHGIGVIEPDFCTWKSAVYGGSRQVGAGRRLLQAANVNATAANTLWPGQGVPGEMRRLRTESAVGTTQAELTSKLEQMTSQPVVYLGTMVLLAELEGALKERVEAVLVDC